MTTVYDDRWHDWDDEDASHLGWISWDCDDDWHDECDHVTCCCSCHHEEEVWAW